MSTQDAAKHAKLPWRGFGKRLKLAREAAGLTQMQVVLACGHKGNNWLVQLEQSVHMPKDMDDVDRLARTLGVSAEWLLFGRKLTVKDTPIMALGVGGPDVLVPVGIGRDSLVALWPGKWVAGEGAPAEHFIVVYAPVGRPGKGWVVWQEKTKIHVGSGRLLANGRAKIGSGPDNALRDVKPTGRVVLIMDPTT